MIDTNNKDRCCGCWACENVCPVAAITMQSDLEGFMYPVVDQEKCIHCNQCESVCPFGKDNPFHSKGKVYAVKNRNENIRNHSSSGGFFSVLTDYVIENGGVVYGATFDQNFNVVHSKAETKEGCISFRGAKYVQSQLGNVHTMIKNDLHQDRLVLFSGTPCQVSSLLKYLGRKAETDKLITCDILCHGVPSPLVWHDYLGSFKRNISSVNFRNKRNGWHLSELNISDGENLLVSENHGINAYSQLYFCHYILRPSCASCPYTSLERCGDFSIGDYWGIEKVKPEFDDDKGVSLVIVNTEKSKHIFQTVGGQIISQETTLAECMQPVLKQPSIHAKDRKEFWLDYRKKSFKHIILLYTCKGNNIWYIRMERKWKSFKRRINKLLHNNYD